MLQGFPGLWSTHWCPARCGKDSSPQGLSGQGHLATLGSPSDGSRVRESRAWALPGRRDQPVGPGARSCSHAQGIADRQRWGQEGIFPRGTLALLPGGFLPSSAASSTTTCHGSSRPFGPGYCLLLVLHDDGLSCPAAGGRKAFFPPPWASECPRGFFAFFCSPEHGPLPGLLWATLPTCLLLMLHEGGPRAPHGGGRKLSGVPGRAPRVAPGAGFLFSGALSTAPCRGSSYPLGRVLAGCYCTSKAASCPGSRGLSCPVPACSGSQLCSSLGSISV